MIFEKGTIQFPNSPYTKSSLKERIQSLLSSALFTKKLHDYVIGHWKFQRKLINKETNSAYVCEFTKAYILVWITCRFLWKPIFLWRDTVLLVYRIFQHIYPHPVVKLGCQWIFLMDFGKIILGVLHSWKKKEKNNVFYFLF